MCYFIPSKKTHRFGTTLLILSISFFKGVGVFATADFLPGAFLLQYSGELVDEADAEQREEKYKKMGKGCYMYYFEYNREIKWYVLPIMFLK